MKTYKKPRIFITVFDTEEIAALSAPVKMGSLSEAYQGEKGYEIQREGFELDWDSIQ